jgi:FAD/FMN-containing dehydrogenase
MPEAVLEASTLADLDASFGGSLLAPDDSGYDDARKVFNAMIDKRPAAIAHCSGVADVMAALALAREHQLEVAVRCGGHSVAGDSVCDDGIVIDVSPMKGVWVDPGARTAWAQAGLNWGELDRETQAFGLAVTGGRMPDTGVAGLALGGGSGWLDRKYGFTVDSILAVDLVTPDGRLVRASADENPELFWALRGGGGNFGVVTAFQFELHEVGPVVFGGMMMFAADAAVDLMKAYRAFMEGAPDEICGCCAIVSAPPEDFVPEPVRGKPVFAVIACYVGPLDAGEAAFRPLREWGPAVDMTGPMPYTVVQQLISPGNPPGMHHYWKSGFLRELTDEAIEAFVAQATNPSSPLTANLMLPLGGASARVDNDATPLHFRDAKWNYHLLAQWGDPAESRQHIEWARAFDDEMSRFAAGGVYVNFVGDPSDELIEASFGPEKLARLRAVKDEYDPDNVFHNAMTIRPT